MTLFHNKMWIMWGVIAGVFIGIIGSSTMSAANESDSAGWVSKIVSIQGTVRVRRHGQARWQPVKLNDTFFAGDQIHVEVNSRAGVLLSNDALMRLDQNSFLIFTEIEQKRTFIFKLLEGAANFFSHRPRSLKILTPFVNGVIEGTEFFVQVDSRQTRIELFDGRILAQNDQGMLELAKGDGAVAQAGKAPQRYILVRPRDSVQWAMYYPPVLALEPGMLSADINQSLALFNDGQTIDALARLESISPESRDANFYTCRAAMRLHVGRIAQAQSDIEHALAMNAQNSDALALKAVIAVVQNRAAEAVDMARQAVQHSPRSASAHIALSYALQAQFKLSEALDAAQEAVVQAPGSGLTWARLADLQLSVGALDKGVRAARKASELAPRTAHAHTILGFAHLTRIDTRKARESFNEAIGLDSAAPLPRLGLGLTVIRDGDLTLGRSEIEIAAGLDPGNSLIRSYLGKAYFDERRGPQDGQQFEIAKTLDPNDPTPWFYDAIRKQSLNRPVEALQDLQKSIALNDNRAVYRSRLQLDQDLAARNARLGRIYNDLGFQELALRQGWLALNTDPANYSAHRLLSDSYHARPRHEIARVSELLQAQLLQSLNLMPVQPQLAQTNLLIPEASGTGTPSFYEFNPLYARNQLSFQGTGIVGDNKTAGDEIALSTIYNRISCSVGQFHYETDGFRENNDLDQDIYNVTIQSVMTPNLNFQAEYRNRNIDHGDLALNWDLENPNLFFRRHFESELFRVGGHLKPAVHSDIIASIIYQDSEENQSYRFPLLPIPLEINVQQNGYTGEIQYLFDYSAFNGQFGGGYYEIDTTQTDLDGIADYTTRHANVYVYTYFRYPRQLMWTAGLSYDALDHPPIGDFDQFNPKLGLNWSVTDRTNLRLAAFRGLKRTLIADQTVEPTHVAGFNQFYDDFNGTDARLYGAGVDHRITDQIQCGVEYYLRRLETRLDSNLPDPIEEDWNEDTFRVYAYWAISSMLALSTEYTYEYFEREEVLSGTVPLEMKTHTAPLKLNLFFPSGFFSRLSATYVNQEVTFDVRPTESKKDAFDVYDLSVGYRFPSRYGMLSFEVNNLFDKGFNYLSIDSRTSHFENTIPFLPERTFLFRLTLSF